MKLWQVMAESLKGLAKLLKKLDDLPQDLAPKIRLIAMGNAQQTETNAKLNAESSRDLGKLAQSIRAIETTTIEDKVTSWKVFANATGFAPYSAYIEFGTGGLIDIPAELQDQAIKFKGRGIRQVNLRPRPYLWPAFVRQRPIYIEDLKDLYNREVKKI